MSYKAKQQHDPELEAWLTEYASVRRRADELESKIKDRIRELKSGYETNVAKVSFRAGRRNFEYEQAAIENNAPSSLVMELGEWKTDWRAVCEAAGIPQDAIKYKRGRPSISIKLL